MKSTKQAVIGVKILTLVGEAFIGKVGLLPSWYGGGYASKPIFYRQAALRDMFSTLLNAYSVDKIAMDYVVKRWGVVGVVMHPRNAEKLMFVSTEDVQASPVVDLGAREQYRIDPSKVVVRQGEPREVLPWTSVEINVDAELGIPAPKGRKAKDIYSLLGDAE